MLPPTRPVARLDVGWVEWHCWTNIVGDPENFPPFCSHPATLNLPKFPPHKCDTALSCVELHVSPGESWVAGWCISLLSKCYNPALQSFEPLSPPTRLPPAHDIASHKFHLIRLCQPSSHHNQSYLYALSSNSCVARTSRNKWKVQFVIIFFSFDNSSLRHYQFCSNDTPLRTPPNFLRCVVDRHNVCFCIMCSWQHNRQLTKLQPAK